jgi:hypothetical protein
VNDVSHVRAQGCHWPDKRVMAPIRESTLSDVNGRRRGALPVIGVPFVERKVEHVTGT